MKNLFILITFFSGLVSFAQDKKKAKAENSFYLSLKQFKEGNLFLPFYKTNQATKFRKPVGHPNEIWIKTTDSTYQFYFEDIWGYCREGEDWRIYNNNAFPIEDSLHICIYTMPTLISYTPGVVNFFSKELEAPINPIDRKD
jgi:hypothetical protein